MAVTPASKGLQFRLGAKLGSNPYIVTAWPTVDHATVTPTSNQVYITIYGTDGTTEKLTRALMTGHAPATYALNLGNTTTWPAATGYQVEIDFAYGGNTYVLGRRLLGIYPEVPSPIVTDQDITGEIYDANDFLRDRSNWSDLISEAWNQTLFRLARIRRPDGEVLDPYVLTTEDIYPIHRAMALMLVMRECRHQEGDRFSLLAQDYATDRDEAVRLLEADLARRWQTGPEVASIENPRAIRSHIKSYGNADTTTTANRGASTPSVRLDTRW